ncbi:MAG: aldehyde dehydrogenase [Marinovum sp.]|nr:aldehyde dehydrogenase [Marinovum sp.]
MSSAPRVFINGFGRIGRAITRMIATHHTGLNLVGVNDIAPAETAAYLFAYDSVFGPFTEEVSASSDQLKIGQMAVPYHSTDNILELDLSSVDLVFECTGTTNTRDSAERGLVAGARRVLVSGPCDVADVTIVLGANDHELNEQKIVSNASCTTHALGPLLKLIDKEWSITSGHMTTVHCYTGSQPTVDAPRKTLARSRAAALSMVPTTTSAGKLIGDVLPHLAGRIEARALRVPTASVSAIDLTLQTQSPTTPESVNAVLANAQPLIGSTTQPLVSTDLRGRSESVVIDLQETSVSTGGLLRVFGWYDNEWGFSARMIDMASKMST